MSTGDGTMLRAPSWRTSVALAVAVPVAFAGFHTVLAENRWWLAIALTSTIVLAAAAATRAITSGRVSRVIAPSLVATLVGAVVVALGTAPLTTFIGLPTFETWDAFARLAEAGVESLRVQEAPALAEPGVVFLFAAGAGALAVLADAVAITWRRPALLGLWLIPIAVTPSLFVPADDYFWLAAAAVSWLLVMASLMPARGRRAWDAAGAIVVSVAAALVVSAIVPSPSDGGRGSDGPVESIRNGVNPIVTLGEDLRREETLTALLYRTQSGQPHYLRLTSVEQFGEEGWYAEAETAAGSGTDPAPAPPGLDPAVASESEITSVALLELGGSWVPMPYPAVGIDGLRAEAEWDAGSLGLRTSGRSVRGETYQVSSLTLAPTPQQLQDAGTAVPEALVPLASGDPEWPAIIADTAASVTEGAVTSYERATALQGYLRGSTFRYSEQAPERGDFDDSSAGAVAAFLTERGGYCVQFASAMALMARTLGIPSRVALGFLPGEEADDDDFEGWVVTSDDLHAWPELYFEGVGWVAFEPTTDRGAPASYTAQNALAEAEQSPDLPPAAVPNPGEVAPVAPQFGDDDVGGSGPVDEQAGIPPEVLVLLGLILLALLPALVRIVVRRRRLALVASGQRGAALAWRECMQSALDLGLPVSTTRTPRANAEIMASVIGERGELAAMLGAVEGEAYTRTGTASARGVTDATRTLLRRLRRGLPWGQRFAAVFWPRTLVETVVRAVS